MYCSVKNPAVLCENHHESHAILNYPILRRGKKKEGKERKEERKKERKKDKKKEKKEEKEGKKEGKINILDWCFHHHFLCHSSYDF